MRTSIGVVLMVYQRASPPRPRRLAQGSLGDRANRQFRVLFSRLAQYIECPLVVVAPDRARQQFVVLLNSAAQKRLGVAQNSPGVGIVLREQQLKPIQQITGGHPIGGGSPGSGRGGASRR